MSSIFIFLIIIFAILYFILAKIRLDWAMMLMLAALPSYLIRFQILGVPFTLLEIMILIASAVFFFTNISRLMANIRQSNARAYFKRKNRYPFDVEIVLLLIISWIALAVVGFTDAALGIWKAYFFEPALVFILILNVFKVGAIYELPLRKILWPLAVSMLMISLIAIFQKTTGLLVVEKFWPRVTGVFPYPNALGLYLGPLALVMAGWALKQITNYRQILNSKLQITKIIFISVVVILSLLAIYLAKSEGALVGVAVGLMIFGLLAGKKLRWVTIVLVIVASVGIMAYAPVRGYAIKKITLQDLSGEIRKQQWRETWQMLKDGHFIAGAGLANYQHAIKPYHQEGIFFNKDHDPDFQRKIVIFDDQYRAERWQPVEIYLYPHNIFLNFWVELGLAGTLLFVWIIIKFMYLGLKIIQNSSHGNAEYLVMGLVCSIVVIIIHGLVDVPYFKNDLAVMFWVLAGMMGLLNYRRKIGAK